MAVDFSDVHTTNYVLHDFNILELFDSESILYDVMVSTTYATASHCINMSNLSKIHDRLKIYNKNRYPAPT